MLPSLLYILSILAANLTAGNVITFVGIQFAVGTLFFGAIFTLRDYIHVTLGRKKTYIVIGLAVFVSFIFSLLGGFPLRILLASVAALLLSESTDTEIFQALKDKSFVIRVISSNIVSIIIDTILFTLIAFYGIWPLSLIVAVVIGDVIIKLLISSILIAFYKRSKHGI